MSFEIEFDQLYESGSEWIHFKVVDADALLPSFISSATGQTTTGTNLFNLCTHYSSHGWLSTQTWVVHAWVAIDFSNNLFPTSSPALVAAHIHGNVDAVNSMLAVGEGTIVKSWTSHQ
jgi:hypothetical protein